jgi:hypothetical protein
VTRRRVLPSRLLDVVAPVVGTLADAVGELGLLLALCAVYAGFTALYRATPLVALAVALCIAAVIAVAVETRRAGSGPAARGGTGPPGPSESVRSCCWSPSVSSSPVLLSDALLDRLL